MAKIDARQLIPVRLFKFELNIPIIEPASVIHFVSTYPPSLPPSLPSSLGVGVCLAFCERRNPERSRARNREEEE